MRWTLSWARPINVSETRETRTSCTNCSSRLEGAMKRRTCLRAMLAAAGGALIPAVAPADRRAGEDRPIQLHLDLAVDPAKEQQMLHFFEQRFRPAAAQQPGYIDLRM